MQRFRGAGVLHQLAPALLTAAAAHAGQGASVAAEAQRRLGRAVDAERRLQLARDGWTGDPASTPPARV